MNYKKLFDDMAKEDESFRKEREKIKQENKKIINDKFCIRCLGKGCSTCEEEEICFGCQKEIPWNHPRMRDEKGRAICMQCEGLIKELGINSRGVAE